MTRKYYPELEVESAGVSAVDFVAEVTKKQLRKKDALQYVKPDPDQISQRALDEANKVICMMPKHSEYIKRNFDVDPDKISVWNVKDPINPDKEPEEAFQQIEDKIIEGFDNV